MDIIRGSLEDISRPASSEKTGIRVSSVSVPHCDRICPTTPFSLLVLTNDAADMKFQSSSEEGFMNPLPTGPDKGNINFTDEEKEDYKLQKAFEEMSRLDGILSEMMLREKEVKRQRKALQAKLWQELLQSKPESHSECPHETSNTQLFLALEAPAGAAEEDNFVPLFETQVPDCEHTKDSKYVEQSEEMPDSWTESFEIGHEETGEEEEQFEGSHCGASKGKKKQTDFVKRNIELVSGEGAQVFLTLAEKERLADLLRGVDEDEEDNVRGTDGEEDCWLVSVPTGQGYTPEPSDLEQLSDIDSKIGSLLPVEEYLSVQSSYTDLGRVSWGRGSEVGWTSDREQQPGEKVLQDIKERRGQEQRLQEIQQQLELLSVGQEWTSESPNLTEQELLTLLDECELTDSWAEDLQTP